MKWRRFTHAYALPLGLLPRLIVRTNEMSEAHPQWGCPSGFVPEWLGARALVRLDRHERRTKMAAIQRTVDEWPLAVLLVLFVSLARLLV